MLILMVRQFYAHPWWNWLANISIPMFVLHQFPSSMRANPSTNICISKPLLSVVLSMSLNFKGTVWGIMRSLNPEWNSGVYSQPHSRSSSWLYRVNPEWLKLDLSVKIDWQLICGKWLSTLYFMSDRRIVSSLGTRGLWTIYRRSNQWQNQHSNQFAFDSSISSEA